MIYYEVRNKSNEIIISNIQKCKYYVNFSEHKDGIIRDGNRSIKSGFSNFQNVSVWIIVEDDQDLIKSPKLFKRTKRIYGEMAESFLEFYLHRIRAHSHTLRSIQGKMKQKIDSLARKEDFRGQDYSESKKKISAIIVNNIEKTADIICYLNKRVSEIDVHIEGFDVLYMGDEVEIKMERHDLKKVLQNIIAPSLKDLKKINVDVNFHIKDDYSSENKIPINYKLMNLAFVNFFDNAIKYSKPGSKIDINFEKNEVGFIFDVSMMSLRIEHDELCKIFEDGCVGKYATEEAGDGIGMHVIKKSLGMINIEIRAEPNYAVTENYNNKQYVKNKFIFESKSKPQA